MAKFIVEDTAYIVENGMHLRKVTIIRVAGGFCTVKLDGSDGAIRLRESRLFATEEEAKAMLPKRETRKNEFWMH